MLVTHMARIEKKLLHEYEVSASLGHRVNKGTAREIFIKDFLKSHLPETISIGSGEIIDSKSKPGTSRNQIDIILYKNNYPKIEFCRGMHAFFVESVAAVIEIKSILTKEDLKKAIQASRNVKRLQKNIISLAQIGLVPQSVLNFVVAYECSAKMKTVYKWLKEIYEEENIIYSNINESLTLDAIFILGKGFIEFHNAPLSFISQQMREKCPDGKWLISEIESGVLLHFFITLQQIVSCIFWTALKPEPYLAEFQISEDKLEFVN